MTIRPQQAIQPYTRTAIFLHWVLAFLLATMATLGWYMLSIEEEYGSRWYFDTHKSIGMVFAALLVIRVVWRLMHQPSALPGVLPKWEIQLARGTQFVMYALMVALPITGYVGASYSKSGVQLFGLDLPHWALSSRDNAELFFNMHSVRIWILVAVLSAHVLGALKHAFIDKDGVFQRMWP